MKMFAKRSSSRTQAAFGRVEIGRLRVRELIVEREQRTGATT